MFASSFSSFSSSVGSRALLLELPVGSLRAAGIHLSSRFQTRLQVAVSFIISGRYSVPEALYLPVFKRHHSRVFVNSLLRSQVTLIMRWMNQVGSGFGSRTGLRVVPSLCGYLQNPGNIFRFRLPLGSHPCEWLVITFQLNPLPLHRRIQGAGMHPAEMYADSRAGSHMHAYPISTANHRRSRSSHRTWSLSGSHPVQAMRWYDVPAPHETANERLIL